MVVRKHTEYCAPPFLIELDWASTESVIYYVCGGVYLVNAVTLRHQTTDS
jgi:hypothetical protein